MAAPQIALPMVPPSRRAGRSYILVKLTLAAIVLHCVGVLQHAFVAGNAPTQLRRYFGRGSHRTVRQAGYEFGLKQDDKHSGLIITETEDGVQVETAETDFQGNYNTVLADKEVPAKGRSYFEVKIVKKPTDAWEYIGLVDAKTAADIPMSKKYGEKHFWGSTGTESMVYSSYVGEKKWRDEEANALLESVRLASAAGTDPELTEGMTTETKDCEKNILEIPKRWGKSAQVITGFPATRLPPMKAGTVYGVDVDMDKGTIAYWADGKRVDVHRSVQGPVDIKGKKLFPAVSIFGRTMGDIKQGTVMEIRSGLEPPPPP